MNICIFCGAAPGSDPEFAKAAFDCGTLLASRGHAIIFGGGNVGLMGSLADGALSRGGSVIGVIPEALRDRELAHPGVRDMRVVKSMHERKMLMHELSTAFMALPGGLGTLDELFESLTWLQLGYHQKPVGILNVRGFYDPLLALLDHAVEHGFIHSAQRRVILVEKDADALLDQIQKWQVPQWKRWIEREQT
jgi:hypothetical protein